MSKPFHNQINTILAGDKSIKQIGKWEIDALRGSSVNALVPLENNASLEFSFEGDHLIICFDTIITPNYGTIADCNLELFLDGSFYRKIYPLNCPNEVRIIEGAENTKHLIRLVYRGKAESHGCRIVQFKNIGFKNGDLIFTVNGEANFSLTDVRAIVKQGQNIIQNTILRNWLTGQCSILGLPCGENYTLEIFAAGWQTYICESIKIQADQAVTLAPIFLNRRNESSKDQFRFPVFGYPEFRKAGEEFRIKFQSHDASIAEVRLFRQVGPARISNVCRFTEIGNRMGVFEGLEKLPLYFLCEGLVRLPEDIPSGLYDIEILLNRGDKIEKIVSCKCVCVVSDFAKNLTLMSYGHMDAWGQEVAEYLQQLISIANILSPDVLLIANACNPAYEAGALLDAEVPFIINFGNHQSPGKENWFGDTIGVVDYGTEISIVNFSFSWDRDISAVETILEDRKNVPCKLIHCYEFGAPIEKILDKYQIKIVHDAHGPGPFIKQLGKTPAIRIGKVNNQSFRLIRFKGNEPVSYTYMQHASNPIPFKRHTQAPIRLEYAKPNDGTNFDNSVTVINELSETFESIKVIFVMPFGDYIVEGGAIESAITSDDKKYSVVTVCATLLANSKLNIRINQAH